MQHLDRGQIHSLTLKTMKFFFVMGFKQEASRLLKEMQMFFLRLNKKAWLQTLMLTTSMTT